MKDEIKNKMDEHIKHILAKPSISNEDYFLLKGKLSELPRETGFETGNLWLIVFILMTLLQGGQSHEL